MEKPKRSFKGIWIPKAIWEAEGLGLLERMLLAEVDSLSDEKRGCYATNMHFVRLFKLSKKHISRTINSLVKKELIISKIIRKNGNKREMKIDIEKLTILLTGIPKNADTLSAKMSIGHGQDCPQVSAEKRIGQTPYKDRDKTKTKVKGTDEVNRNENNYEKVLGLVLKKSTEYEIHLHKILPARNRSERTTYARIKNHLCGLGRPEIFDEAIEWAKEAKTVGENPRKMYVAKIKQETGFKATGGRLLDDDYAHKLIIKTQCQELRNVRN